MHETTKNEGGSNRNGRWQLQEVNEGRKPQLTRAGRGSKAAVKFQEEGIGLKEQVYAWVGTWERENCIGRNLFEPTRERTILFLVNRGKRLPSKTTLSE